MLEIKLSMIRFSNMRIYRFVFIFILFMLPFVGFSQIGIKFSIDQAIYDDWNSLTGEENLLKTQYGIGIEYWLRLKNVRVEFFPELFYAQSNHERRLETFDDFDFKIKSGALLFKTHLYIMDFYGDCNCPTFSKDGNFLTKGFFLAVSPAIRFEQRTLDALDDSFHGKSAQIYGQIQFGAGVDLGLTETLTITPFFNYIITPSVQWEDIGIAFTDPILSEIDDGLSLHRAMQIGIKFNYRMDYRY